MVIILGLVWLSYAVKGVASSPTLGVVAIDKSFRVTLKYDHQLYLLTYCISTIVDYLMPYPQYTYILHILFGNIFCW